MSVSYYYYRMEDFNYILVGYGRSAWLSWGVMEHEGPIIRLDYLGYPKEHRSYLPYSLLSKLYERFAASSKTPLKLAKLDAEMDMLADERYGEEQANILYEDEKILVAINLIGDDEGYKYLTPYLPELLDAEIINRLAADPWLNNSLLSKAQALGVEGGGIPPNLWTNKSASWSKEWREYCDKLMARNPGYRSFDI